jgi:uncharacterized cupin superfamily protein
MPVNVTNNYLVPSSGKTHSYDINGVFSAIPVLLNFATISKDFLADFNPQGVFIDNSQATGPLTITIVESGYSFSVPAGATQALQFPAPENQTHSIVGLGQASIVYVDFPVLPYTSQFFAVLPAGTSVALDAGTSVALDAGTSVALDAGTSVALDAGTSVALDAGTSVALDAGTSVALDAGTSVALDAGTSVALDAGTSVATDVFDGTSYERKRTPNIFKSISATATGSTALWTPAAGKKFRLMKIRMKISADAAAAAAALLTTALLDSATNFGISSVDYIPLAAVILEHGVYEIDLGNGYLSTLADNVLNVNLSFALTVGGISITACGTEE